MAPPPKPIYPPPQGPQPGYPQGQTGVPPPPPPAGYKPMGPPPAGYPPQAGVPPPQPPAGYKPMGPPPAGYPPQAGAPPPQPPAGYKPGMPPPPPPAGYKPMGPPPGQQPVQPMAAPPPGAQPKPSLPPPPPSHMVVAKPPPKPIAPVKKPKKPKKFLDTPKKKMAVVILVIGLVIAVIGFVYPVAYWAQKSAYSSANLKSDQTNTGGLILYNSWDAGQTLYVHDAIVSIKPMQGNVFIEGVTYIEKLSAAGSVQNIGDNLLVEIGNGQYIIVPTLTQPNIHEGDNVLIYGTVKMIIGKDAQNHDVRREIIQADPADIEKNSMDTAFLVVAGVGLVILFVGLGLWMFFVYVPEETEPAYKNIHDERKKEFMEQVAQQGQKKEYACPVCGLNMTYKAEYGKWYCEICNKLY